MKEDDSVKINQLEEVFNNELGNVYKTIIIDGEWGIGKSYYINHFFEGTNAYSISLFGINSTEELKSNIAYSINKRDTINHMILTNNDSITINLPFLEIPLPKLQKDFDSIIKDNLNNGNKNILIVDDLERKGDNLTLKELFGVISELSTINHLNIIIVLNSQYISQLSENDRKIYSDFKEKVVDRIYHITSIDDLAIKNISDELKYENGRKYIIDIFKETRKFNLRTLIKTINFLNIMFDKIDLNKIGKNQINILIECSLAMFVTITNNEYKDETSIKGQALKIYWENNIGKETETYIVGILFEVYNSNDYSQLDDIISLFNVRKKEKIEKDLFYCSLEELKTRINYYKNNVMLRYNSSYNIFLFIRELSQILFYMDKYNIEEKFTNDEIENSIELYVKRYDVTECDIFDSINKIQKNINKTLGIEKEMLQDKIILKYVEYYIDIILKDRNNPKYIEQLYSVLTNNLVICDIKKYDDALKKIIGNDFFIPDVNNSIDEKIWDCIHIIFDKIHFTESNSILRSEFLNKVNQIYKSCNEVGKYRLESLANQYCFEINNS